MSLLKEKISYKTDEDAGVETSLSSPVKTLSPELPEVVIGLLTGFNPSGQPLIDFIGNPYAWPIPAMTTAALDDKAIGEEMALMFVEGDDTRPLIIGAIRTQQNVETDDSPETDPVDLAAKVDGKRIEITGKEEIVLKCGKASITLTRAGKILIRGKHILSRSSGANRIKGGSVQIN